MYIITGGGTGLGRALACELARRRESVLIVGRREKPLRETAACSADIRYFQADMTLAEDREQLKKYLAPFSIKGLIHNAGAIEPIVSLESITLSDWRHVMTTNVEAPLFLTQQLLPALRDGRVLHIGSGAAYFPVAGWGAYCSSKAALSMLTQCWQLEAQAPAFASVMPGIVETKMLDIIRQSSHMQPEKLAFFLKLTQENRLLLPETVALFLTWLLLDTDKEQYASKEWDIYDKSHHSAWLVKPHVVPDIM